MHRFKRLVLYVCLSSCSLNAHLAFANSTKSIVLPNMGTTGGASLSIAQEQAFGDAYLRIIRSQKNTVTDPVLTDYIQQLGNDLVAHANDVAMPFTFILINNPEINAFAFFGGHVALNTGLFLHAQTESELASVMAHEIAHITQRHLARALENQSKTTPLTLAALAGGILLAIAAPQAGIAAITASQAGAMQSQINFTRANEKEADRFGIATLARSHFDVNAMPTFFTRLANEYRYASKPPAMLLTHPLPEDRLTDSRERARLYPQFTPKPKLNFQLAKARAIAYYLNLTNDEALNWFDHNEKSKVAETKQAAQYGKALIYIDKNQYKKAENILTTLKQQNEHNDFYLDALTDVYLGQQKYNKAKDLLSHALTVKPTDKVLQVNYANTLLQAQKYQQALSLLRKYCYQYPNDSVGWRLLSEAAEKSGNSDESLAALGELLALNAQWDNAISYYTQASQMTELGSYQQARYDARIDQLIIKRDAFSQLIK